MPNTYFDITVRSNQAAQIVAFRLNSQGHGEPDGGDGSRQDGAAETFFNCVFHYCISLILSSETCAGRVVTPVDLGMAVQAGFANHLRCRPSSRWHAQICTVTDARGRVAACNVARCAQIGCPVLQ